jgi:D-alanyl-D-alanine dipeptidase
MRYKTKVFHFSIFLLFCIIAVSCGKETDKKVKKTREVLPSLPDKVIARINLDTNRKICDIEKHFIEAGLINIQLLDSTILVDLRYSGENNFLKKNIYGELKQAYLQKEIALMVISAHKSLKMQNSNYRFLIWDAARPRSIQKILWDLVDKPDNLKQLYVANPVEGSIHNYGCSVDLTIVDGHGNELNMGTDYDHFGELAFPEKEPQLVKEGKLTSDIVENRQLLRKCMIDAGFTNNKSEWWHFDAMSRQKAQRTYKIIE